MSDANPLDPLPEVKLNLPVDPATFQQYAQASPISHSGPSPPLQPYSYLSPHPPLLPYNAATPSPDRPTFGGKASRPHICRPSSVRLRAHRLGRSSIAPNRRARRRGLAVGRGGSDGGYGGGRPGGIAGLRGKEGRGRRASRGCLWRRRIDGGHCRLRRKGPAKSAWAASAGTRSTHNRSDLDKVLRKVNISNQPGMQGRLQTTRFVRCALGTRIQ